MDDKIDKQFIHYAVDIVFGNTNKHLALFAINGETEFIFDDLSSNALVDQEFIFTKS